jgi:anti-sigma regulatory factor (Ser/Thr protein kinase)
LKADARAPLVARREVGRLRNRLGSRCEDALLVVSELVTNGVVHGPASSDLILEVTVRAGRIRIQVSDSGPCFEGDPRLPFSDGRGLLIVEALADEWGVLRRDGCTVWAELALIDETAETGAR